MDRLITTQRAECREGLIFPLMKKAKSRQGLPEKRLRI